MSLLVLGVRQHPSSAQTLNQTWYVDTNCTVCGAGTITSPFQTIRPSLTYAVAGDIVLVAQGTYTEHLSISKPVSIMGGYRATFPTWTRDITQYKTIIVSDDRGIQGDWDGDWLGDFSVVETGSTYRMWYTGGNEVYGEQIGYADSPDSVNWFDPLTTPLLPLGQAGAWDDRGVADPFVLTTNVGFMMWYVGLDAVGQRGLGAAFSMDGLNWYKYLLNPVLRPDNEDEDNFGFPVVVRLGVNNFHLWYSGWDKIWHATSTDGYNWTKDLDTPALTPGDNGAWDDDRVFAPYVIHSNSGGISLYEMWYAGEGTLIPEPRIGYAWSEDGITWNKSPVNPVMSGITDNWEEGVVTFPAVVKEGATNYTMWYRGGLPDMQAYGQATSSDGFNWTRSDRNPLFAQGMPTQWGNSVLVIPDTSGAAVLDGFIITGGFAEYGAGIYMVGSNATIRNCQIINNLSQMSGAGMYIVLGEPVIENTIISTNTTLAGWAGGLYVSEATPVISGSIISNNMAKETGGAMVIRKNSELTLIDSMIINNLAKRAGGILLDSGSTLYMNSNKIAGNAASQAGAMRVINSTLSITNTFIVDNHAKAGDAGGISFERSSGSLVNVTLAGNSANEGAGGIRFSANQPTNSLEILNSILYFNGTDDISCSEGACNITYSDIQEGISGDGNISVDPLFVNQEEGDYHLSENSPVINAGTSNGAPSTDFEGDPRPVGGVDMGADEVRIEYSHYIYIPFVVK